MLAAVLWCCGPASAASEASFPSSPPISIDDAETVERGHAEINLTAGFVGRREAWESEAPLLDGNYGLTDNIHVNAEIPWVITGVGGQVEGALGDAAVAIKLRAVHRDRLQLTLHPEVELPHLAVTVPLILDVALGASGTGLGVELAHTFTPGLAEDTWGGDVGLAHPIGEAGDLMLDLTAELGRHAELGQSWAELGYVREGLFHQSWLTLLSSAGVSTRRDVSALLGVQIGI